MSQITPFLTRALLLCTLLSSACLVQAQNLPVTTTSEAARAEYDKGMTAVYNTNWPASRPHFAAAVAADPNFGMAHLWHAMASDDDRAGHMAMASKAKVTPAEADLIASVQARMNGEPKAELALVRKVANQYPKDLGLQMWLANAYMQNDDAAAALAVAQAAVALDPTFAPWYNVIGYTQMELGNDAAAEEAMKAQIKYAPQEPNPYDSYGEFLLEAGRLEEAKVQYDKAIAVDPAFDPNRVGQARVAVEMATRRYAQASVAKDIDALVATYYKQATLLPPGAAEVTGHDDIRAYLTQLRTQDIKEMDIETVDFMRIEDTAIHRAKLTLTLPNGATEEGKVMLLWGLDNEGKWLCFRSIWNWDTDSSTTATAGK